MDHYQWEQMHKVNHDKFKEKYGEKVFFVYSRKKDKKAKIDNPDTISAIMCEIADLQR